MSEKPKTVAEILETITEFDQRAAVYNELVDFLGQFISNDSFKPTKGIKALTGPDEAVPEEIVELVQLELKQVLKKIREETTKLKGQTISGEHPKRRKRSAPKRKKAPPKRKTSKKASTSDGSGAGQGKQQEAP